MVKSNDSAGLYSSRSRHGGGFLVGSGLDSGAYIGTTVQFFMHKTCINSA